MPAMSSGTSAGVLPYRRRRGHLEVLVAHPGGPFWAGREDGAWSLPKGEPEPGEPPRRAAARELAEETGLRVEPEALLPLGTVRLRSGKVVHGFAVEADLDPATVRSNTVEMEWPPGSGRRIRFAEIDRVAWVSPDEARRLLNPAQAAFVERLVEVLNTERG